MEVKVYSARWCGQCRVAKDFLTTHSIPFVEIDIDENPEAAQELERSTGKRAVPHFVVNGQWIQPYSRQRGFHYEEMKGLLLGVDRERPAD